MAAPSKFVIGYALLAKLEGSYGAGGSLAAATDAVLLEELIKFKPSQYANDGARPMPPASSGYQKRVVPSGRFAEFPAKVAPKGAGAAYSASVTPNIHALLRACGMDGTVTTTGGSEKWEYSPTNPLAGYGSDVIEIYGRGQKYPFTGVLGSWTYSLKPGEVPVVDFAFKGLQGAITDVTYATLAGTLAYPAPNLDPPKAVNIGFTLNGVTHVVRDLTLTYNRNTTPRLDANVGGHAGFAPSLRTPQLAVTIESPALATADLFTAFDSATNMAWNLGPVGAAQYNKYSILGNGAQLMSAPDEDADGEVSLLKLSMQLNPSGLGQNDELLWRWN